MPDSGMRAKRPDESLLAALKERAEGVALITVMKDGTEIVYCGEIEGDYIGWTPREWAEKNGWTWRGDGDPELAVLIEAVEAAYSYNFEAHRPGDTKPYRRMKAAMVALGLSVEI